MAYQKKQGLSMLASENEQNGQLGQLGEDASSVLSATSRPRYTPQYDADQKANAEQKPNKERVDGNIEGNKEEKISDWMRKARKYLISGLIQDAQRQFEKVYNLITGNKDQDVRYEEIFQAFEEYPEILIDYAWILAKSKVSDHHTQHNRYLAALVALNIAISKVNCANPLKDNTSDLIKAKMFTYRALIRLKLSCEFRPDLRQSFETDARSDFKRSLEYAPTPLLQSDFPEALKALKALPEIDSLLDAITKMKHEVATSPSKETLKQMKKNALITKPPLSTLFPKTTKGILIRIAELQSALKSSDQKKINEAKKVLEEALNQMQYVLKRKNALANKVTLTTLDQMKHALEALEAKQVQAIALMGSALLGLDHEATGIAALMRARKLNPKIAALYHEFPPDRESSKIQDSPASSSSSVSASASSATSSIR